MQRYVDGVHKIFSMTFARIYPLYVNKVERKGRTVAELDRVIEWLTGFTPESVKKLIDEEVTLREFFNRAALNENAPLITGVICGVRIEDIEDPLMQKIRYLDKLVDELAKGRPLEKILRT